jgi:DNA-binding response OmpR family regulator
VTGQGERKDRQLGLEGASYNYVSKPFQVEDLLAKVQEVLLQRHSVKP